ncbi:MAG: ECF transporter S component [Clostridia bacterium]|nr:ECF transporter S component [Clostridia bacterium]
MEETGKKGIKAFFRRRFTAKRIALMAAFVALSYVVSFLEFPIFPAAPFLQLDFGNVFVLLIGFLLGPMEGVLVCFIKESFRLIGSGTGGVGELANFLVTCSYILLPTVLYVYKKKISWVIVSLCGACLIGVGAALLCNRFLLFPLFFGAGAAAQFEAFGWFVFGFNLIKTVSVSLLTLLLYKRLSNFLKRWRV